MNKESDGSSMFNDEYQTSREGPVFQNEELNTVSHAREYLAPKYQMEPKTILYADLQGQQCYKLKATGSTMKALQNQKQAKIKMRERRDSMQKRPIFIGNTAICSQFVP